MRPLRLDLDGFTVFREPTTVDFTDTDFFVLVGPTGSGKSSVLDAICFALYGTVPRWGDRRAIANALAPSSAEAKVRLVFESGGARYVLSRVVRRDAKGNVATRHAGLEALPAGFELSHFDTGLGNEDLGEVLAGTPAEVDAAVLDVVGLPYEQFTKCVVLPQGEFAAFLHAKPAERQRILVNLLGLDVYGRVRERAGALAASTDGQLKAIDAQLGEMADADEAALQAAAERVAALRSLTVEVDRLAPQLAQAHASTRDAVTALDLLDRDIARLEQVHPPRDVAGIAQAASSTRDALTTATQAVTSAEEHEEKLRGQLSSAGDEPALRRLLDAHAERESLATELTGLRLTAAQAEAEHGRATAELAAARDQLVEANDVLEAAREAFTQARTHDAAAALRPHLRVGEHCPLCTQPVRALPDGGHEPEVAAAETAGKRARKAAETAQRQVDQCDRAVRDLDRALAAAGAHTERAQARLDALERTLAGAPAPAALRRELTAIGDLRREVELATGEVRAAREAHRTAAGALRRAEERLRTGWQQFDTARDALATLGPPPAQRDDLAVAWAALAGWAREQATRLGSARAAAFAYVESARYEVDRVRHELAGLFTTADLPVPGETPDAHTRAAAVAFERAEAARQRVEDRLAEAARLREQRAAVEREGQVAKALAQHLRADRFERWLLAEALDSLVEGASRTLRELSAGQYDLGHDKGEFFVVDHHDAGLRRAVRTLSGGETFQASLALALALSEQLAGMSTATASLESIVLDEGFGSLDSSTLDTVAATLESLAARGDRMVGVVTHVGALAERVPIRFEVHRDTRTAHVRRVGL